MHTSVYINMKLYADQKTHCLTKLNLL